MIEIHRLGVTLEGRRILDGIHLHVAAGESVALVGPNGSGKSTVLRCVLGLVPFEGQIAVGGHDAVTDGLATRRLIASMPQKAVFGEVTASAALRLLAGIRDLDPGRIPELLERVDLAAHAHQRVRIFSGGMQQRLALAAVLHADCPVILLDEPTASLDRRGQQLLDQAIRDWRARGRTLILSSHRPEEVARFADRTVELEDGRQLGGLPRLRALPLDEDADGTERCERCA